MRRHRVSSLVWVGLLLGPTPLWGTTRHVPSEHPSIQAALDSSAVGDTVLVAPGTYSDVEVRDLGTPSPWTACVFMPDGVVLQSEAGADVTLIEMTEAPGPQASVVVALNLSSLSTAIEGFTITTPLPTRGVDLLGRITFQDCIIRDTNAGQSSGGGVNANGYVTLIRCAFVNCRAFIGGAIYHANGRIEMYDCTVRDCGSVAAFLAGSSGSESSYLERCTFEDNWATTGAGALGVSNFGGTTIRECRFTRNEGGGTQGAVALGGFGPKLVHDCLFFENRASGPNGRGGALRLGGPGTVVGNTFYGNTQVSNAGGGAVSFDNAIGGALALVNNIVAASGGVGGAIYANNIALASSCNVFWQNAGGTGLHYTPGPTDRVVDPFFCDAGAADFRLMVGSPCLPEGSLGCGLIGAFGEGCGIISIEPTTWGQIKAAYRGEEGVEQ